MTTLLHLSSALISKYNHGNTENVEQSKHWLLNIGLNSELCTNKRRTPFQFETELIE